MASHALLRGQRRVPMALFLCRDIQGMFLSAVCPLATARSHHGNSVWERKTGRCRDRKMVEKIDHHSVTHLRKGRGIEWHCYQNAMFAGLRMSFFPCC